MAPVTHSFQHHLLLALWSRQVATSVGAPQEPQQLMGKTRQSVGTLHAAKSPASGPTGSSASVQPKARGNAARAERGSCSSGVCLERCG